MSQYKKTLLSDTLKITTLSFLVFCLLITQTISEYEPAYLKVCSREFKQVIESSQCSKGVWLRQSIEPSCICVRGVWALTDGFCDDRPVILVGDGHCYNIQFEIRSAKLIGDPQDPFKPKVYVAPLSLDGFYEITEENFTPTLLSDTTMIIGVNPRQVAQRKDYGLCIDLNPKDYGRPLHIYLNPRRLSKEWILDHEKEYTCPSITAYTHHIAFGEMFSIGKNRIEQKLLVQRNCHNECPKQDGVVRVRRNQTSSFRFTRGRTLRPGLDDTDQDLLGALITPEEDRTGLHHHKKSSTFGGSDAQEWQPRPRVKTIEEREREKEEMRASATQTTSHYETEVNEQTLRMMHAHISPVLLKIPNPKVVTREYHYFQHIRQVVEKACPQEYVPKELVKGLMRMFRQLLWETQDTFQHSQGDDHSQFNRTLSRLKECSNRTMSPSILFATYSESWNPKDNISYPKPERCPVPITYAINATFYNRTDHNLKDPRFLRNFTHYFPRHMKFNASQVDYVIEAAWKISVTGLYRCSKYFDGESAIDFSNFFHQVESFFNYEIIKRWYYEKSVQATYDIVKMMFPSYDLKKFMFGLDSCLFGIQEFSDFDWSNIWLQRPKVPHTDNDLSSVKYVLPDATSGLDTRDWAPDPIPALNFRRKREVNGFNLWSEQARCINDYMEPVMEASEFGYHLPTDCVPPVDPFEKQINLV